MDSKISVYSLLQKLESSRSSTETKRFSQQLMGLLSAGDAPVDFVIKSMIEQSLGTYSFIRSLQNKSAFEISYRSYVDNDTLLKLAFGVSYMPNHNDYSPDDDVRIIKYILGIVKKKNLDLIVNDITVNFLQVRNGETSALQ